MIRKYLQSSKNYYVYSLLMISLLSGALFSCQSESTTTYLPESSGPLNQVTVFASEDWYHSMEEGLRDTLMFGKVFPGLYYPPEIMFGTRQFDPALLNRFKNTRLMVEVQQGTSSISIEQDKFARPQAYVQVTAPSPQEAVTLLQQNQDSILRLFRNTERRFVLAGESHKDQDKTDLKALGVDMLIPKGFVKSLNEENFLWYRRDFVNTIENVHQSDQGVVNHSSIDLINLFVYKVPFYKPEVTIEDAIAIRDSVFRLHTKGNRAPQQMFVGADSLRVMTEDHLQTEKEPMLRDFYDFRQVSRDSSQSVYETQGYWSMTLTQMGGPYTMKIIQDHNNNMLYIADAVIFAPLNQGKSKKRDYLTQYEALFTTFKLNHENQ
ncbi:MAG: DUF4837 family protein [Weeksellaceae bacterium]|nr:DUF4837 family protein [Weeksellaceae bacterium]